MEKTDKRNDEVVEQIDNISFAPSQASWAMADFLQKPPSVLCVSFLYSSIGLVAVSLIYSFFAKVPVAIEARGSLITEELSIIRAPSSARVNSISIADNKRVKKGEILLTTENNIDDKRYSFLKQSAASLLKFLNHDKGGKCGPDCRIKMNQFSEASSNLPQDFSEWKTQVFTMLKEWETARASVENAETLSTQDRRDLVLAQSKISKIIEMGEETELAIELERLKSHVESLNYEVMGRMQLSLVGLQQARGQTELKLKAFMEFMDSYRRNQVIAAPIDGVVANLTVAGVGQLLKSGDELMQIVPTTDTKLIAVLQVQNKDIAKVTKEMPVILKLDALPSREFGTVEGRVLDISFFPVSPPTNALNSELLETFYRTKVVLSQSSLKKDGKTFPFKHGMQLQGTIVVKRERILTLAIRKIFNLKDAITGES